MIRINLLPVRAEKKRESLRQQALGVVVLAVLLAGGIVAVHTMLGNDIAQIEGRIAERKAEIARLDAQIGQVRQFKQKKRDLEEKIAVISTLEQQQRGPSQVLYELTQIVPEKLWIESLKDSGGSLSLQGVAIDNQTIARFMTQMEASQWFQGVRLEVTKQVARGGASLKSFSLSASIVYPKAG
ncbi:MAG: PilN domain-containing protein [Deferrisomatales bacterium]|nr:PilN domain-containing protein [Deferrisomatales bacterium]